MPNVIVRSALSPLLVNESRKPGSNVVRSTSPNDVTSSWMNPMSAALALMTPENSFTASAAFTRSAVRPWTPTLVESSVRMFAAALATARAANAFPATPAALPVASRAFPARGDLVAMLSIDRPIALSEPLNSW